MPEKTFERVSSLSGGQQQRVAVARAVYREADALIGDEPVSSIDPHQAGAVLNLLKQRSKTLILAMHDVQLALEHFDRIVGLRLGRIVFDLPGVEVNDKILTDLYRPC
jgi:phosphonate transport system ATP-binding protein